MTASKWKIIPMDTQSPTKTTTSTKYSSPFKPTKVTKAWKCDDITPVTKQGRTFTFLNQNFPECKYDM